jgi:hypothetical protein
MSAVVRQYPPSGPIIDIGGGNGLVSQGLIQSGFDAIVIEPSPAGLEPVRGTFFFSVLVPAIFLLRTTPSLMGLKAVDQVAKAEADHAAKKRRRRSGIGAYIRP